MFDFSFGEIGLIAVVALVVLGPERLPKVARTAGALVRRARTSWQSVKIEIEREFEAEDLKRSLDEVRKAGTDLRNDIQSASSEIGSSAQGVATDVTAIATPAAPPPTVAGEGAIAKPPDPDR
jgi:sec-independent protein translocase protein TatB